MFNETNEEITPQESQLLASIGKLGEEEQEQDLPTIAGIISQEMAQDGGQEIEEQKMEKAAMFDEHDTPKVYPNASSADIDWQGLAGYDNEREAARREMLHRHQKEQESVAEWEKQNAYTIGLSFTNQNTQQQEEASVNYVSGRPTSVTFFTEDGPYTVDIIFVARLLQTAFMNANPPLSVVPQLPPNQPQQFINRHPYGSL
jgi:hypothetical protein